MSMQVFPTIPSPTTVIFRFLPMVVGSRHAIMETESLCAHTSDDGATEALSRRRKSLSYRGVVDNGELC